MNIEDIKVGESYRRLPRVATQPDYVCMYKGTRLAFLASPRDEIAVHPSNLEHVAPPAPKVRLLAIKWSSATMDGPNVYEFAPGNYSRLGNAPEEAGVVGYLYADMQVRSVPVWPYAHTPTIRDMELRGEDTVKRATHVVCVEVGQ